MSVKQLWIWSKLFLQQTLHLFPGRWGSSAAMDTREQSRSCITPPLFQSFHGVGTLDLLLISTRTYSIQNNQAFCSNSKSQSLFLLWLEQKICVSKQNNAYMHSPFPDSESVPPTSCNGRLKRKKNSLHLSEVLQSCSYYTQ